MIEPDAGACSPRELVEGMGYQVGSGWVAHEGQRIQLGMGATDAEMYSDAQLDDYHVDGVLRWKPPVSIAVRARFSHAQSNLRGTAGFGFWNDPFGMTVVEGKRRKVPRLHQAVWYFFAAEPSTMPLAQGIPGHGWKMATIDASSPLVLGLLPFAPLGMLACRYPPFYRLLWPVAQRILKIDEAMLTAAMDEWHDYVLVWEADSVRFVVDGVDGWRTRFAPRGPLGFVAWIDNQYMVATPQGLIRNGVIATGEQWLELTDLTITKG